MGFLQGKKILITGIVSNRSIAYGIAKACHREGAELAFSYANDRFADRIKGFAAEFGSDFVCQMDVSKDEQIENTFAQIKERWGCLDGVVHSIGFAPREAIAGNFLEGCTRDAFHTAMDISAYSFPAVARAAIPLMEGRNGSFVTLTYLGGERVVPNYNTMGLCKAALEASTRYIAASIGPKGMRCNAISAGPIKTLAAAGIQGFSKMLRYMEANTPMRRTVTIDEVGNLGAFLLSDLSTAITGEVIHADAGFHCVAMSTEVEE